MTIKSCSCGLVVRVFEACIGKTCKVCKGVGHAPQEYCLICHTFTCPVYGDSRG